MPVPWGWGLLCDEYIDSGDGEKGGALDTEALHWTATGMVHFKNRVRGEEGRGSVKWNMTRLLDLHLFSPAELQFDRSTGTNFLAVFRPSAFVGGQRFRWKHLNIFPPQSPGWRTGTARMAN